MYSTIPLLDKRNAAIDFVWLRYCNPSEDMHYKLRIFSQWFVFVTRSLTKKFSILKVTQETALCPMCDY